MPYTLRRRFRSRMTGLLLLGSLSLLISACGTAPSDVQVPVDPGVAGDGNLAEVLGEVLERFDQPALAGVLIRNGTIFESAAVGLRVMGSLDSVTVGNQWRLGGMDFSLTATLAAVLVERGVIDWGTTVGEVFSNLDSIHPAYQDVRLEELVSHTSGLRPTFVYSGTRMGFVSAVLRAETLQCSGGGCNPTRGTWVLSGVGITIVGTMLEVVTGETWEVLMQRELFDQLGMASSGFGIPSVGDSQPAGHRYESGRWVQNSGGLENFAGRRLAIHTSLDDYAAYLVTHLAGAGGTGGLVSADGFAKLHAAQPGTVGAQNRVGNPADGYALGGWFVAGAADRAWVGGEALWHTGSESAWVAEVWLVPGRDFAMAAFANADGPGSREAVHAALEAFVTRHDAAFGRP